MAEWNVFSNNEAPDLAHDLGEPMKEEPLCKCGDLVTRHDRLGCMAKGCDCTQTLFQLTRKEPK